MEIEVRGTTLFYTERGEGEPVVFVHGSISDYRTWAFQLGPVGERHRAIAYSRRYHWPNAPVAADGVSDMDTAVEDLAALLRSLDAAPAHLVGNSFGAFTSLVLAHRHPELVRSLVLEEPPAIPLVIGQPPRPARILASLLRRPRVTLDVLAFGANVIRPATALYARGDDEAAMLRFVYGVLGREAYEALPEARREQMRANISSHAAEFRAQGGFSTLTADDVRRVTVPTLLLTGERSPRFLVRLSRMLEGLLPSCSVRTIPGASHAMHEENAGATNDAILSFLGSLTAHATRSGLPAARSSHPRASAEGRGA